MFHSLLIQFSSTEKSLFYHKTALFGPSSFNFTAPLQLSFPRYLCSTIPTQNFTGHVVLVSRGNCSAASNYQVCDGNCAFATKVSNAQFLGALAVIVGNTPDHNEHLFRMPTPPDYPNNITIPSIFISSMDHFTIRQRMGCNDHDDCSWMIGSFQPLAIMDEEGEIIDPTDDSTSDTLRLAGFLLLVLPIGWCLIAIICLIYKFCKERRARDQRTNVARDMPMVAYRRMSGEATQQHMNDGSSPVRTTSPRPTSPTQIRIHNESCAICLEDFTPELQIKLLPCGHGFHQNCIDPWLNERSELCPICKSSILDHQQSSHGFFSTCIDCR